MYHVRQIQASWQLFAMVLVVELGAVELRAQKSFFTRTKKNGPPFGEPLHEVKKESGTVPKA